MLGHVDVGKTTIGESFLGSTLDIYEEEQVKSKTLEVGWGCKRLKNKKVTLLDAPGHRKLVPELLKNLHLADVAVLVISAKTGEFESGFTDDSQTKEHVILVKCIGIDKFIVLINKMDCVNWNQTILNDLKNKIKLFLNRCKIDPVTYIPCSGKTGQGILWGSDTLNDYLEKWNFEEKKTDLISIIGKEKSNYLVKCNDLGIDSIVYTLSGNPVKIKSIKDTDSGMKIISLIPNIQDDFLTRIHHPLDQTDTIKIKIHVCKRTLLTLTTDVIIHVGNKAIMAEITEIVGVLDTMKRMKRATYIKFPETGICVMKTREKWFFNTNFPHLSRLIIRKGDETIAYGKVIKT